jgi:glycosyltransferase involved in cell wall biosynthesis
MRMRIALVSQEYPPETAKGGIGTQTHTKAHGLAALGHEVVVISRAPDGRATDQRDGAVRVIRVAGFEKHVPVYTEIADWITYSALVAAAVARVHAETPLDLVEFPEWAAEGFVHLINRTSWNHIPTVIHLHGPLAMFGYNMGWPPIDSEFFRTGTNLEATAVRLADAIVSSSRCSLLCVAEHYGRNIAGAPVLHTGVDTTRFTPGGRPKAARPTIIFAGKLAANKGVHTLLEAALALTAEFPDLHLRLLGRGDPNEVQALRARAAAAGRPHLLDLPGFVSHAQLPAAFQAAHVFAAPSSYEPGPGFVNLEAMACGLPVVTTTGSGSAEVVIHESTGLLVPPADAEALATALGRLLNSVEMRERLGRDARAWVEREAAQPACVARFEGFYRSVVDGAHGQSPAARSEASLSHESMPPQPTAP